MSDDIDLSAPVNYADLTQAEIARRMAYAELLPETEEETAARHAIEAAAAADREAKLEARIDKQHEAVKEVLRLIEWGEPAPLITAMQPEPYPIDSLPEAIRDAIIEVHNFVQAPIALTASSAMSALSIAGQGLINVSRGNGLGGVTSLYMLAIADSGERKTTSDNFFTRAIREHERQQNESLKTDIIKSISEIKAWEAEEDGKLAAIKQASKSGKPTKQLRDELADLEAEKPLPIKVPRLLLVDETSESLGHRLAYEWPSSGIVSNEAGIVFGGHAMAAKGAMRSMALMNILWDGGKLPVGRRTTDSFDIEGVRLTLGLQVQPGTLKEFMAQTGDLARGTGFMARFLVSWPDSTQGTRAYREAPEHWPALTRFDNRLTDLLSRDMAIGESGMIEPDLLQLSQDAKALWVQFHDAIESELAPDNSLFDVRDVASKTADNAARLAALFHLFEHGDSPVCTACMHSGCTIAQWHLGESKRFFNGIAVPADVADAEKLDRWIIKQCKETGENRMLKTNARQRGPVRDGARLADALTMLSELNRLRVDMENRTYVITVNPALLQK